MQFRTPSSFMYLSYNVLSFFSNNFSQIRINEIIENRQFDILDCHRLLDLFVNIDIIDFIKC